MRLRRTQNPERELAKAIAKRGVRTLATVKTLRATGETRADGIADEFELLLSFATDQGSAPIQAVVRQFMSRPKLAGVEAGQPVEVVYDPLDPAKLLVLGSPKYRIYDGTAVAVEQVDRAGATSWNARSGS